MWLCVCRDLERGMDGVEEEGPARRALVEEVEVFVASVKGVEEDVGNFGICKMATQHALLQVGLSKHLYLSACYLKPPEKYRKLSQRIWSVSEESWNKKYLTRISNAALRS